MTDLYNISQNCLFFCFRCIFIADKNSFTLLAALWKYVEASKQLINKQGTTIDGIWKIPVAGTPDYIARYGVGAGCGVFKKR